MQTVIHQIQDLLEGLENLRNHQKELISCTESQEVDALPPHDFALYQRLQRERAAKGAYLAQLAGTRDDLKILLGQLSRLAKARETMLKQHKITHPMDLPSDDLRYFMKLWEMTDRVAGMLDGVLTCEC